MIVFSKFTKKKPPQNKEKPSVFPRYLTTCWTDGRSPADHMCWWTDWKLPGHTSFLESSQYRLNDLLLCCSKVALSSQPMGFSICSLVGNKVLQQPWCNWQGNGHRLPLLTGGRGISCTVSGCWQKCGPALWSFRAKLEVESLLLG